jgi:hypothetical protein
MNLIEPRFCARQARDSIFADPCPASLKRMVRTLAFRRAFGFSEQAA